MTGYYYGGKYYGGHDDDCDPDDQNPTPDGYVDGTGAGELIDAAYDGDPDGDFIDNDDALLPGETGDDDIVRAGGGNDTVLAGAGDDDVYAGSGNDVVEGGSGDDMISGGQGDDDLSGDSGNDIIYGDTGAAPEAVRESFEWDKLPDPDPYGGRIDHNDPLYGTLTQDTGQVNVTFTQTTVGSPETTYYEVEGNTDGIVDDGNGVDSNSTMSSYLNANGEAATYSLAFSQDVDDVSFRINDIDYLSEVVIRAYDADGNLVDIQVDAGSMITATDEDAAGGTETLLSATPNGGASDSSPQYSALVTIPGPISRIEITHTQVGHGTTGITVSDVFYDVTPDLVDGSATTSGDGNDAIDGGSGEDTLFGEGGDDTITDGAGADLSYGGADRDTFIGGSAGDHVDGGEAGIDEDTLDLRGMNVSVEYDPSDPEAGIVSFLDDDDNVTGTMTFENIETVLTDPEDPDPQLDGYVEGTAGGDLIDAGYDGDPDGDMIDNDDALLPGDSGDDDVVLAFSGDDTVIAGEGSDDVYGGAGNDSISTGAADQVNDHETFPGIPFETGDAQLDDTDYVEGGSGEDTISTGDDADTIYGGDGADSIDGGLDDDEIYGGAGNDTVDGSLNGIVDGTLGNDLIFGGSGDDSLVAGVDAFSDYVGDDPNLPNPYDADGNLSDPNTADGKDTVYGGIGNDTIISGDDADALYGGSGEDRINAGIDDDYVEGGQGADVILGGHGSDTILGGSGDDSIDASSQTSGMDYPNTPDDTDPVPENDRDEVYAGHGNDTVFGGDDDDMLHGGSGDDVLDGGIDEDTLVGDYGNDELIGGAGEDLLYGNQGADTLDGGDDADALFGGSGDDVLDGGQGADSLVGGDGNDSLTAGNGEDTLEGGAGADTLLGGSGADAIAGGSGDDSIRGGTSGDSIEGGAGNDFIAGDAGDDQISGGAGNDEIYGGSGNDTILGESGDDLLYGSDQEDEVYGGLGADTIFGSANADQVYGGADRDSIVGATTGDYIDGGSSGDDYDTLDLTGYGVPGGHIKINYTSADREDGIVEFYNPDNTLAGTAEFHDIENVVPCFTPGTLIATPRGEVPVEELQEGDRVITRDNGMQQIRWKGSRHLRGEELLKARHLQPVLIRKGALGYGLPERDMVVSPNHRMLINNDKTALYFEDREVLVAAKHLTGLDGIERLHAKSTTYVHFLFDQHEVILSDGAWSETFQPGHQTMDGLGNAQRNEIFELFPELRNGGGLEDYHAARKTLKKHEADLLILS